MTIGGGPSANFNIHQINWVRPSAVLGVESAAFTPWLSQNLTILEPVVGVEDLQLISTEFDVAGKMLDILSTAASDSNGLTIGVAIQAQYGETNHDHLEKLLTYAAGTLASMDRVLAVWLVDEVHPAHLAAIEMLNLQASDRIGFVLARVRFVATGDGAWGVDVDVVSRPNEFIRDQQQVARVASNPEREGFLSEVLNLSRAEILSAGFAIVSSSRSQGYYALVRWPMEKRWVLEMRSGQPNDGFMARIYANSRPTTSENETILAELAAHDEFVRQELPANAILEWDYHVKTPNATIAALGNCRWPGVGYTSDPKTAASYLLGFCKGIAKSALAASL